METLWQDLRYGARMLIKTPGFTAIAVLSLALGIGANTALFSVVDAMLLRPLPVKDPERLVMFRSAAPGEFSPGVYAGYGETDEATGQRIRTSFPYQSYRLMRERLGDQSALSDLFAFGEVRLTVNADGQTDVADGQAVSGNYYAGLGVPAILGRAIIDEDDQAGASPVAVLSYRYWQRRFGGSLGVVGKQINLNNISFTIIGVTPNGFDGAMQAGSSEDVTIPISWEPRMYTDPRNSRMNGAGQWWLRIMGRLKPGAAPLSQAAAARAQLEAAFLQSVTEHRLARQLWARSAGENPVLDLDPRQAPRLFVDPGGQGEMNVRRSYAPSLYLLLGAVGLALLIACANVANLLLARAAGRASEVGVRLALGASRRRLIRQFLTESALLSLFGGGVGILFALWIKNGLLAVAEWGGTGMRALEPKLDWRVLGATLGLSLLTGILFGLAPAWRATKVGLTPSLKDAGRSAIGASRSYLSRALIVAQVALSLLLLIGAGLFLRTLFNLRQVDLGFNTQNLMIFGVQPGLIGYKDEKMTDFFRRLAERLEAAPGVQKVTFSGVPLLAGVRSSKSVYLRGALTAVPDAEGRIKANGVSHFNQVRENFLEALGIPLLAGRALNARDDARSPKVVVVNQSFADKFFPGENPIGKRFTFDPKKPDEVEIVGVARDARYARQREGIPPTAYAPWRQSLDTMEGRATFEARFAGDPTAVVAAVRQAAREVDGNLPLDNLRTQAEQADRTLAMERLFTKLLTLFGLLAQLLAAIGLFGLLAYSVSERTREIGVRMALGADRRAVLTMILRQGMTLALAGVALGLTGAYGLTKYLESSMKLSQMLYGVHLSDPLTYVGTAASLILVALLSCYFPARRATKVDPQVALRCE